MVASIKSVANYLLHLSAPNSDRGITPLKLQKLTFYAQALSYAARGKRLFEEDFEAWVHGPVSPDLYHTYKEYVSSEIPKPTSDSFSTLDNEEKKIIKLVWNKYGKYDGKYLENKTHKEKPWKKARGNLRYDAHSNRIIEKSIIDEYYSKKFSIKKR